MVYQNVKCEPDSRSTDLFFSCSDIVSNIYLLSLTYIQCSSCFLFNAICIPWHLYHSRNAQKQLSLSLVFSDALMSLYVSIILVSHYDHSGNVAYVAMMWKSSLLCKIAGAIIMISVSTSNMSTLIISMDRFISIVWKPFQQYGFSHRQCCIAMSVGHMLIIIPPILASLISQDVQNSLCIPVGNSVTLPFSVYYFTCSSVTFMIIAVLYIAIMFKVKNSSKISKLKERSMHVLLRLWAIVLTNFIPSMAIASLSILSLFPNMLGSFLEANVAFFLFPLNACLNPIFNTLTTRRFLNDTAMPTLLFLCKTVIKSFLKIIQRIYKLK